MTQNSTQDLTHGGDRGAERADVLSGPATRRTAAEQHEGRQRAVEPAGHGRADYPAGADDDQRPGREAPARVRVAAVDCGTNSIRLLVADLVEATPATTTGVDGAPGKADPAPADPATELVEVVRRMEIVRLGQGVDRTGRISDEALARTLGQAREYAAECVELGVERVRFVATSAARDARNAEDFLAGIRSAFAPWQVGPEIVTGEEEARLSFTGATAGLASLDVPGPYLVVDIGGGSTEFIRGDAQVEAATSLPMGCVRFHERYADAPQAEVEAAIDEILARADAEVGLAGIATLVGLAGSVTTVTAHALGLTSYDSDRIHHSVLPVAEVLAACADLVDRSPQERAQLGFLHPGRVDVIGAGALVWSRIVRAVAEASGVDRVVTSEHDILDGVALSLR